MKLTQPIIQKDTAVQDFLRAVLETASNFASFWTNTIQNNPSTTTINALGETIMVDTRPDLYMVIDRFRIQRQILQIDSTKSNSESAFSTSQQEKQIPICICGQRHYFSECIYIDAALAPDGWTEDLAIRKQVDDQLRNPEKKAQID
jgi:hypothetical protein